MISPEPEYWVAAHAPGGGTCYRVVCWVGSALPPESLEAWRARKSELLARMSDAGVRGSRGALAALADELKQLNISAVEEHLDFCSRAEHALARVGGMRAALRGDAAVLGIDSIVNCGKNAYVIEI